MTDPWEDFRSSFAPATAGKRSAHFRRLLKALRDKAELQTAHGAPHATYGSVQYHLDRLLDAHVDFADAQLKAAEDGRRALCELKLGVAPSLKEDADLDADKPIPGEAPTYRRRRWFRR